MSAESTGYGARTYSLDDVYRLTPMAMDGSDCIADQMRLRATVSQRDDLLAALEAIAEGCSFPADDVQRACRDRARAAIAKARPAEPGEFRTSISETFNAGDE